VELALLLFVEELKFVALSLHPPPVARVQAVNRLYNSSIACLDAALLIAQRDQ
jgi:hypothetical protein